MTLRGALAVGAVAAGVLALTGCEKPYPGATVWSGTQSEFESALCWSFDPAVGVDEENCVTSLSEIAAGASGLPELEVSAGNTLGISVDPVVADNGWVPVIAGQRLVEEPLTSTYWRFTFPQQPPAEGFEMQILANTEDGEQLRGVWAFKISPRASAE